MSFFPPTATHGAALSFETLVAMNGDQAPMRVQPDDDTLVRVIAGVVRLTVAGAERLLHPGAEAIVPAGAPHRLAAADGEARLVSGRRPARR